MLQLLLLKLLRWNTHSRQPRVGRSELSWNIISHTKVVQRVTGVERRGRGGRKRRRTYLTIVPLIAASFYVKMSLKPIAARGYAKRTC